MRPWQINSGSWQEAHEALFLHGESVRNNDVTHDFMLRVLRCYSPNAPVQHVYSCACDNIQLKSALCTFACRHEADITSGLCLCCDREGLPIQCTFFTFPLYACTLCLMRPCPTICRAGHISGVTISAEA